MVKYKWLNICPAVLPKLLSDPDKEKARRTMQAMIYEKAGHRGA